MEDTHWWVYLSKLQPTKRRGERRKKKMIAAILKYRSSALTCRAFTATLQQQLQLARGSRHYAIRRKECAESGVKLNQIANFYPHFNRLFFLAKHFEKWPCGIV